MHAFSPGLEGFFPSLVLVICPKVLVLKLFQSMCII